MKEVLICSPSIGDLLENLAVAESICEFAANQGYVPVISPTIMPGRKPADGIQQQHINKCDEVWLYCAEGLAPEVLSDLRCAVRTSKPVKLVREAPQGEPQVLAADSYAEAPGLDKENRSEADEGQPGNPSSELIMEAFSIDGLLLALRELDDIVGGALSYEWWEAVSRKRDDYLSRLGIGGLMEALDHLVEQRVLPPWPWEWKAELEIQFGQRDWLGELPDLDRDNLEKIGDNEWHKLGHQVFLAGEYRRALDFLVEAITDNPHNFLAWSDIGQCYMNLSDLDMAIKAFQASLLLAPANFYAWSGLGHSFLAMRRYSEAITAFDQALACKDDHDDHYVADLRDEALRGLTNAANNMAI